MSKNSLKNFKYHKGIVFLDGWQFLSGDQPRGDCNDFALTKAVHTAGGWVKFIFKGMFSYPIAFWLVYSPSNTFMPRHVALWVKGKGWIDSTNRKWRDSPTPHTRIVPIPFPWALVLILWGATIGKLF